MTRRPHWSTRRIALLAATTLVVVGTIASPGAASAQTNGAPTPPSRDFRLLRQDPWTPLNGSLQMLVRTGPNDSRLSVRVVVHQLIDARSSFDDTVDEGTLGRTIDELDVPVALAPRDRPGTRALAIGLQGPDNRDANRLAVRRSGVYPVEVELHNDNETLGRFTTYLVAVEPNAEPTLPKRLGVAWVWPLVAPPSTLPGGEPDPATLVQLTQDGRLGRQVNALANSDVPLTIAPSAETIDTWAALAANGAGEAATTVSGLQNSLGHVKVLDGTYVPINLPSLLRARLANAADAQFVSGDDVLKRFFANEVDTRIAVARPIDTESLLSLRARGVDRFIVESSALAPADSRFTPSTPFALQAPPSQVPGGAVTAVMSDAGLTRLLTADGTDAARAQRFLAGLSVVAFEEPTRTRGVAVVNPDDFDPSSGLVNAVLSGLRSSPVLKAMTAGDIFDTVPQATADDDTPETRSLAPYSPPAAPITATGYERTQVQLDGFRSLVGVNDEGVRRGERSLLLSPSSTFEGTGRGVSEIQSVDATISDVVSKIRVPATSTITITARSGEIPLTFRNDTGKPVHVHLDMSSQKLDFPKGSTRTVLLPPRSTTLRIAVEARTSGSFPFRLVLTSADGQLPITDTQFRVRSTFVSTVGIGLTVGAGLFLVLWWGWDIRRRRRRRRVVAPAT